MRYKADITAGSLKLPESRVVAGLLLQDVTDSQWHSALYHDNVLQARSPKSAQRVGYLIRRRLETMDEQLWRLVRDGSSIVATQSQLPIPEWQQSAPKIFPARTGPQTMKYSSMTRKWGFMGEIWIHIQHKTGSLPTTFSDGGNHG